MEISQMRLDSTAGDGRASVQVDFGGHVRSLWYSFDRAHTQFIDLDCYDAFVIGLFPEAMNLGCDLTVDGAVSSDLIVGIRYYMHVMRALFPELKIIKLKCKKTLPNQGYAGERRTISSFSGGIDSFCTLLENCLQPMPDGDRVSCLLFANVGSHGRSESGYRLFEKRLIRVQAAARDLELPLLVVNSNLDSFYSLAFEKSHCARTVSCIMLFQALFQRHLVPSTNAYADFGPDGSMPIADHLLSTRATQVVHDGAQHSRIEKSRKIADWSTARKWLYVCTRDTPDAGNCSQCDKCIRAMLTFELLGLRQLFEPVFDYAFFSESRTRYIRKMNQLGIEAPNYYWREIVHYARNNGYKL